MFIGYHPEVEELFEHKKENNMKVSTLATKYVERLLDLGAEFKTNGVYRLGRFDFYPNKYKARDFRTNETLSIKDALDEVIESNLDSYETTLKFNQIPETFDELSKEADPQLSTVLIQTEILGLTLILQSKGIINADELKDSTNFAYEKMMLPVLKASLNATGGDNVENEEKDKNV